MSSVALSCLVLASCGGESGTSAVDESFCKEVEKLDQLDIETDIAAAAGILSELAQKAPSDEVRDALNTIAPIFERLSTVDENDATALSEIAQLMSSPEVTQASAVLERYGAEVCKFPESTDTTPSDMSDVSAP